MLCDENNDALSLPACADWLQNIITEWTDSTRLVEVESAHTALSQRLTSVQQHTTRRTCLPVKVALQLQLRGQDCWNATVLLSWSPERLVLKRGAQQLAAYLFLAGHYVFAPRDVFEAHVSHHLDDAEKCIVMCLKVSKLMVQQNVVDDGQRMLSWAADIASACRDPSKVKVSQYIIEVHFAQLHLFWTSGQYIATCAMAEQLARETQNSISYREALHEFIYEAAVAVICRSKETKKATSGAEPRVPTTNDEAIKRHKALQSLLSFSLRLLSAAAATSVKQQRFLGMTELQLSCSLLSTEAYAEAVDAATAAYDHLHTFEPLVVRLKAESLRHNAEEATRLFHEICVKETNAEFAELCAVATCVVESNPTTEREITSILQERATTIAGARAEQVEHHFRFLCFLLHLHSEWSTAELLRHLTVADDVVDKTAHRFFFCALWRLAMCDGPPSEPTEAADCIRPSRSKCALPWKLKWRCLDVAVLRFAQLGSTDVERQSVLLDMSRLAVELHSLEPHTHVESDCEGDDGGATALEHTWELWKQVPTVHPVLRACVLLAQAQLAFLMEKCDEGLQRVRDLWCGEAAERDADAVTRSCTALVHFLLERSMFVVAGAVAQQCLVQCGAHTLPGTLELARVCAIGCLASGEDSLLETVANLFAKHMCPIFSHADVELARPTALWWSRFLWYLSDRLLEKVADQSVRLSYAAWCLHQRYASAEDGEIQEQDVLTQRVNALLEVEFDLYVDGQPTLTCAELQQLLSHLTTLCDRAVATTAENVTNRAYDANRWEVTQKLASVEATLRHLEEINSCSDADVESMHLSSLITLAGIQAGDLEQVAAVCHRVAGSFLRVCRPLRHDAVLLQIAAAEVQWRRCDTHPERSVDGLGTTVSMFYTAYSMTTDADGKAAVFTAFMHLLEAGSPSLFNDLLCSKLKHHSSDGASPSSGCEDRLVETMVEFFAVEAWNESVQWNVLQGRDEVTRWRGWAWTLAGMLNSSNATRIAITEFYVKMPLL
jgi:hypothetical protein